MDKETSSRVSSIASGFTNFRPANLTAILEDKDPDALANFCAAVRTLAGSSLTQDETPGQFTRYGDDGTKSGKAFADAAAEVYPAPSEFTDAQIAADPMLHFFHYAHLPPALQTTSRRFFTLAYFVVTNLPRNAERTVALRKLLEAKDAAVRASLPSPTLGQKSLPLASPKVGEPVEIGGHDEDRDGPIPFNG